MVGWKDLIYLESHDYEHLSEDLSFPISSKSSERKACNHGSQQWAALSVADSATQPLSEPSFLLRKVRSIPVTPGFMKIS